MPIINIEQHQRNAALAVLAVDCADLFMEMYDPVAVEDMANNGVELMPGDKSLFASRLGDRPSPAECEEISRQIQRELRARLHAQLVAEIEMLESKRDELTD